MTPAKIYSVCAAARELLERADALAKARDYETRFEDWIEREVVNQKVGSRSYVNCLFWFRDNGERPSTKFAASALRRQSMELTRALAEMRKP